MNSQEGPSSIQTWSSWDKSARTIMWEIYTNNRSEEVAQGQPAKVNKNDGKQVT